MTYRTPDTVPNERVGQGEQPYKDNREAMTQKDAELRGEAAEYGETRQRESAEDRREQLEQEAKTRFDKIQKDRS